VDVGYFRNVLEIEFKLCSIISQQVRRIKIARDTGCNRVLTVVVLREWMIPMPDRFGRWAGWKITGILNARSPLFLRSGLPTDFGGSLQLVKRLMRRNF
jgi:hypothetical protein